MNGASGYLFYLINKYNGPTRYIPVYKSEIKPSLDGHFTFEKHSLLTSTLAAEDEDREIKLEVYQSQKSGKHKFIGGSTFTL